MDIDRRAVVSPALILQSLVVILGGAAVYYSTISEFRVAIAESKTNRTELASRVGKLEALADQCVYSKYKSDTHDKEIDTLTKRFQEFDERLREHDDATRKLLPLGRRSQLDHFRLE